MVLELIVLEGLAVVMLACIGFAYFSGLKVFWVIGFFLLTMLGFLSITAGGIITNHYYDVDGVYSSTILPVDSGAGFIFSNLALYGGLIMFVWSIFFTTMLQASGERSKAFVWD